MKQFAGFPDRKVRLTSLPEPFFTELLPAIDSLGELKLTIYLFWRFNQLEGTFRYIQQADIVADTAFMASLGATPEQAEVTLTEALQHAVARGSLLAARLQIADVQETLYFFNTAKGRAAVKAIEKGAWRQANAPNQPIELLPEPPNIFQLYEANIGSLTPLLADALKDAEETYPASWIEEAFRIAVENNKRSWRYIAAILERWKREGFHERRTTQKNRPGSEKDSRRYIEGEFADDIEH